LESTLEDLFGECRPYELVPLRRTDVQHAAEESGIGDPSGFLGKIDGLDLSSLAIKPVTLEFLISTYLKGGDLPNDHLNLYEKGCRILCEEPSDSRRGGGKRGHLNPDQRLANRFADRSSNTAVQAVRCIYGSRSRRCTA
jgi:hypothetical protein